MFQDYSKKIHDLEAELTVLYREYFEQFLEYQKLKKHNKKNKKKFIKNKYHNKNNCLDLTVEDLEFNANTKQGKCDIKRGNCVGTQTEDQLSQSLLTNDGHWRMSKDCSSNKNNLTGLNMFLTVSTTEDEDYMLSESEESISSRKEMNLFKTRSNKKIKTKSSGENSSLHVTERDTGSQSFIGNVNSYSLSSEEAFDPRMYNNLLTTSKKSYRQFIEETQSDTCIFKKSENLLQNNGIQLNLKFPSSKMLEHIDYKKSETADDIASTSLFKLSPCLLTGDKDIDDEIISFYKQKAIHIE